MLYSRGQEFGYSYIVVYLYCKYGLHMLDKLAVQYHTIYKVVIVSFCSLVFMVH